MDVRKQLLMKELIKTNKARDSYVSSLMTQGASNKDIYNMGIYEKERPLFKPVYEELQKLPLSDQQINYQIPTHKINEDDSKEKENLFRLNMILEDLKKGQELS